MNVVANQISLSLSAALDLESRRGRVARCSGALQEIFDLLTPEWYGGDPELAPPLAAVGRLLQARLDAALSELDLSSGGPKAALPGDAKTGQLAGLRTTQREAGADPAVAAGEAYFAVEAALNAFHKEWSGGDEKPEETPAHKALERKIDQAQRAFGRAPIRSAAGARLAMRYLNANNGNAFCDNVARSVGKNLAAYVEGLASAPADSNGGVR